jgi:hypothetical protein
VILFNEIKVWAGIEACFAKVKYSIYCLKTPKKRQMTFKKFNIRCQESNSSNETPNVMTVGVENYGLGQGRIFLLLTVAHLSQQLQLWNFDNKCHTFWMSIDTIWW